MGKTERIVVRSAFFVIGGVLIWTLQGREVRAAERLDQFLTGAPEEDAERWEAYMAALEAELVKDTRVRLSDRSFD
jgi:hypothetical protein